MRGGQDRLGRRREKCFSVPIGFWVEEGRERGEHCFNFLSSKIPGGEGSVGEKCRKVLDRLRGMLRRKWLLPSKRILETIALLVSA